MARAEKLLQKLERYEQAAYDGGYGSDWLESVGEGFKFYVQQCRDTGRPVTIAGWEKYLDALHAVANSKPQG